MKKLYFKIITEDQNHSSKAQKLSDLLKKELELNVNPEIKKYNKFNDSYVIEFFVELSSQYEPILKMIDLSDKIASPWLLYYHRTEKEITLIFNKTEHCRFGRNEFNVIRWANIEQMK